MDGQAHWVDDWVRESKVQRIWAEEAKSIRVKRKNCEKVRGRVKKIETGNRWIDGEIWWEVVYAFKEENRIWLKDLRTRTILYKVISISHKCFRVHRERERTLKEEENIYESL